MFYRAKGTIGNYPMSLPVASGSTVSPPVGPVGVNVAKPPEDLEILHFTVPR